MKKIIYEEPVGKLRELDNLYIAKMKEALKELNIYGILFYNNPPHYHPSGCIMERTTLILSLIC